MPYQFHVTDPAELWKGGEQSEWGKWECWKKVSQSGMALRAHE